MKPCSLRDSADCRDFTVTVSQYTVFGSAGLHDQWNKQQNEHILEHADFENVSWRSAAKKNEILHREQIWAGRRDSQKAQKTVFVLLPNFSPFIEKCQSVSQSVSHKSTEPYDDE